MASQDTREGRKDKKNTMIIILLLVLLLLTIAGAVAAVLILTRDRSEPEDSGYTLDENNYQQIVEEMDSKVGAGYFETYMNTEWTFKDGTSETEDAILGNSPNNTKPIRCEVLLDDTREKIFETGVIPVGALVPAFKLDKDLEAGIYEAVCMIYLMDEKTDGTYEDASSAGFHVTITVAN